MEVRIKTDLFRAVMFFMANNDQRYYLNGVYLETGSEGARLVATDGRAMAIAKVDSEAYPESRIIIPVQLCQAARKLAKVKEITFRYKEGFFEFCSATVVPRTLELIYGPDIRHEQEVGGAYPDYRRVIPTNLSGEASHISPELLVLIEKSAKELDGKSATYPGVIQNGKGNSMALIRDDLFILAMPMSGPPDIKVKPPAWGMMAIHKSPLGPRHDPQATLTF